MGIFSLECRELPNSSKNSVTPEIEDVELVSLVGMLGMGVEISEVSVGEVVGIKKG